LDLLRVVADNVSAKSPTQRFRRDGPVEKKSTAVV